ncbi:MAG: acetyl-CoA carboxylase biotin carboxyl carrier protein [Caldiserica bacterium]|nr:acetyl-CoA carboxylase biotin carboxyl carrier protein [Caldisericota bacterium]
MDLELLKRLSALLREEGLSELTLVEGGRRITLKRELPRGTEGQAPAAPPREEAQPREERCHVIRSPLVGTFWRRPNPDSPPFVEVGDRVEEGQTLCVIESMKVMNEIRADVGGVVEEILVEDGSPVEYGQPLFKLVPE